MGGAAAAASEVTVSMQSGKCMFCHKSDLELPTTTIVQQLDGVKVTVEGAPAMFCRCCSRTTLPGNVMIPIDEAIAKILIATGVAVLPDANDPVVDDIATPHTAPSGAVCATR